MFLVPLRGEGAPSCPFSFRHGAQLVAGVRWKHCSPKADDFLRLCFSLAVNLDSSWPQIFLAEVRSRQRSVCLRGQPWDYRSGIAFGQMAIAA